jgi:hypothetical protein
VRACILLVGCQLSLLLKNKLNAGTDPTGACWHTCCCSHQYKCDATPVQRACSCPKQAHMLAGLHRRSNTAQAPGLCVVEQGMCVVECMSWACAFVMRK